MVLDGVGADTARRCLAMVAQGGRLVAYSSVELFAWALAAELRLVRHETFGFDDAAEAHRLVLARANVGEVLRDPRL